MACFFCYIVQYDKKFSSVPIPRFFITFCYFAAMYFFLREFPRLEILTAGRRYFFRGTVRPVYWNDCLKIRRAIDMRQGENPVYKKPS